MENIQQAKKEIIKRIKQLRRELGYKTPQELAEKINVPVEDIEDYEKGKEPVPLSYVFRLCQLAGIQVRYFLKTDQLNLSYRGKKKLSTQYKARILAIKDGLKLLKEERLIEDNRIDYIEEHNPEIAAHRFIEYYGLKKDGFNTYETIIKTLSKRDMFVFFIPLEVSALVLEEDPFFIVINSKEPQDRWSFSLLHEVGHLIAPPDIKKKEDFIENYANIFAAAVLIPKEYRYRLWEKLGRYIEGRNYNTFFNEVRKLNKLVSPEAVFLTLIREFMPEPDYGRFNQFKKKAKEIRQTEKQSDTTIYIPEEYTKKISKIELITEGRKKELVSI